MRDLNSVRCASGICPVYIRYVSGDCPAIPLTSVRRLYQYRPDFIRPGPSEEIVDAKFEAILNSLPAKEPRSRLEPYSELITEMRKRGHSYREITQVLKKACGLKVGTSTVNDFVLARSKSKAKPSLSTSRTIATKKNMEGLTGTYKDARGSQEHWKASEGTGRHCKDD